MYTSVVLFTHAHIDIKNLIISSLSLSKIQISVGYLWIFQYLFAKELHYFRTVSFLDNLGKKLVLHRLSLAIYFILWNFEFIFVSFNVYISYAELLGEFESLNFILQNVWPVTEYLFWIVYKIYYGPNCLKRFLLRCIRNYFIFFHF